MLRVNGLHAAVEEFSIDLGGLSVLTELATGPFTLTPLLAALGGASSVVALGQDSRFASFEYARKQLESLASSLGVASRITCERKAGVHLHGPYNLVTNLGAVRPIDRSTLGLMAPPFCVALMWEPWEYRSSDLDLFECRRLGIPVIGTNESHPMINTMSYVGLLAVKLLTDLKVDIPHGVIALVGTERFTDAVKSCLTALGTQVRQFRVSTEQTDERQVAELGVGSCTPENYDAIVIAHQDPTLSSTHTALVDLAITAVRHDVPVVNICGVSEDARRRGVDSSRIYPSLARAQGCMSVTTGELGYGSVLRLHAGGLRAAQVVCRAMETGLSLEAAIDASVGSGFGLSLEGVV
jgi:hypothetical protein